MRIALFTDTYYPEINGVATSCLNLKKELTALGHTVHLYAPKCKGWQEHPEEGVFRVNSAPFLLLRDRNFAFPGMKVYREAVERHYDVVHTNSEFMMGYLGRAVAKASKAATVHTYHTAWEDYTHYVTHGIGDEGARAVARRYSEWWCDKFDRVISPTAKTADLLAGYGVDRDLIRVIPSGIDLSRFLEAKATADIPALRAECGVREGERVLLNVGRLAGEKNVMHVMEAFPGLLRFYPDVRFVIIGEGPEKEALAERARELGVGDKVSVVGPRPWERIHEYYAIGDVFAAASHSETQGLTYAEAMATGLCVCSVRDPCLDGVITDGKNGILCEDAALEAALVRAFSKEGEKCAARAPGIAAEYALPLFASRVESCYREALELHGKVVGQTPEG